MLPLPQRWGRSIFPTNKGRNSILSFEASLINVLNRTLGPRDFVPFRFLWSLFNRVLLSRSLSPNWILTFGIGSYRTTLFLRYQKKYPIYSRCTLSPITLMKFKVGGGGEVLCRTYTPHWGQSINWRCTSLRLPS